MIYSTRYSYAVRRKDAAQLSRPLTFAEVSADDTKVRTFIKRGPSRDAVQPAIDAHLAFLQQGRTSPIVVHETIEIRDRVGA